MKEMKGAPKNLLEEPYLLQWLKGDPIQLSSTAPVSLPSPASNSSRWLQLVSSTWRRRARCCVTTCGTGEHWGWSRVGIGSRVLRRRRWGSTGRAVTSAWVITATPSSTSHSAAWTPRDSRWPARDPTPCAPSSGSKKIDAGAVRISPPKSPLLLLPSTSFTPSLFVVGKAHLPSHLHPGSEKHWHAPS